MYQPPNKQKNEGTNIYERIEHPSEEQEELSKMAGEDVSETLSEEIFLTYRCTSLPSDCGAVKHPGEIVEAGSLSAQRLPEATYDLFKSLPNSIVDEGQLSDLQLEGILFACQQHQVVFANGYRAGFFIGDGAGVGKGRQISGIILDNYSRGRSKHIWFSITADLRLDAQRDLRDIGCYVKVINGCQQLDKETRVFGLPPDFQDGVVFSTYATLVSSVQKASGPGSSTRQSRLQQLIDWCGGKDFDGCLIFDECHKAKHFLPGKEESSSKVAIAVTEIQRLLPKARVVYCSATGVTDVKNMAFMERLGLWGEGTAFKDFNIFLDCLTKRGLGALEMLAMEMKAAGMYVSRGLSYRQTEFMTVEYDLTRDQMKVWDTAVHVWNELKRSLGIALGRTKTNSPRIWTQFWASHQRFFKQLCMSMKVPKIVEESQNAMNEGYSVVIGLQTTGEASLSQEISRTGGNIRGFISLTKEILARVISQYFPTEIQIKPGETKTDQWCVKAKQMLLDYVEKINLPNSPLDDMIDQLGGPANVAEMTGRRGRIVRQNLSAEPRYEARETDNSNVDSLNIQERNSFMSGSKLVAIISDAASTGISLHADNRAQNQRRRIHLTAELPWSADKAVQQLGRSHRSNQSSGPIYKLVTTNLGGERRFAAAVARRLQSLGALTKGDRRAATGADLTQFNFDTRYGRQALRVIYSNICQHRLFPGVMFSDVLEGAQHKKTLTLEEFHNAMKECLHKMDLLDQNVVGAAVKEKEARDVSRFLNRILGLTVERQNLIFSYFCECLKAVIHAAKREGTYNEGVTDMKAKSITMIKKPEIVFPEAQIGTSSTKHVILRVDRGISWEEAFQKYEQTTGKMDGFYCSKREQKGKRLYLLAIQKEHAAHLFTITRPNTGVSPFEEEKLDLVNKYIKITAEDAEKGWKSQYNRTETSCIHGPTCKSGPDCIVGCRTTKVHLLCGGIISMLVILESTLSKLASAFALTRENRTLRVVRVELDDGERLVGLRYPEPLIVEASKALRESNSGSNPACKITRELETPVNERSRSKAITPPVTLKKFFQVNQKKSSVSDPLDEENDISSANLQISTPNFEESKKEPQELLDSSEVCDVMNVNGDINNENDKIVGACRETVTEDGKENICERKNNSERSLGNFKKVSNNTLKSKTLKPDVKSKYFSSSSKENNSDKRNSLKRTSSSSSIDSHNKRQKQSSLMTAFTKLKAEKPKQSCPICSKSFDGGISNQEVNNHIDNCLIE